MFLCEPGVSVVSGDPLARTHSRLVSTAYLQNSATRTRRGVRAL